MFSGILLNWLKKEFWYAYRLSEQCSELVVVRATCQHQNIVVLTSPVFNIFDLNIENLRKRFQSELCCLQKLFVVYWDRWHPGWVSTRSGAPNWHPPKFHPITLYQISLKLHRLLNEIFDDSSFEHVTILNEIICTRRQTTFEILRNNKCKIGMNTSSNKLYHLSKQIGLEAINLGFVHFKKLMKIQFLKNWKT